MTVHRGAAVNLNSEVWEHGRLEDRLREVYEEHEPSGYFS